MNSCGLSVTEPDITRLLKLKSTLSLSLSHHLNSSNGARRGNKTCISLAKPNTCVGGEENDV